MNLVFCLVSLLGAFLLFQVQPVISKFILPWFGGSPGVWTTCMLFFQIVLFAGYSYAHLLARCRPRTQAWVHGVALLVALLLLPIIPDPALKPSGSVEPTLRILTLLALTVGVPYLVLSATSPLVQVWFSHYYPQKSPWRLYSLSNVGSLTALLSYPVLIETRWDVLEQARIWSGTFFVFALLMGACAFSNRVRPDQITPEGDPHPLAELHQGRPTWSKRLLWVLLPAFASVMLLATTNHVCQDVAVIPFLWVAPLSLYLVSFIICFDHPRWYARRLWALPGLVLLFLASGMFELGDWNPGFLTELLILLGAMFVICMICHGELAHLKPDARHLTEYYLLMSAGGALGGLLISVVAPIVFKTFFEWSLALVIGYAIVAWIATTGLQGWKRPLVFGIALLALIPMLKWELTFEDRVERHRDFYGLLSIGEGTEDDSDETYRTFVSGHVKHGRQSLKPERRLEPLTYYSHATGIGQALLSIKDKPDARVGVIGMGAGTVACYGSQGQTYRFYEINPEAVRLALKWFTFIPDLQQRGAHYDWISGDARLMLEQEKTPQNFDVLLVDAFSGDSVPVHLLTREAFELYVHHLHPDGIIAVHITNHALNLAPVVQRAAQEFGLQTVRIADEGTTPGCYPTDYLLLTRNEAFVKAHPPRVPANAQDIPVPLWTDHRHNLFQILRGR